VISGTPDQAQSALAALIDLTKKMAWSISDPQAWAWSLLTLWSYFLRNESARISGITWHSGLACVAAYYARIGIFHIWRRRFIFVSSPVACLHAELASLQQFIFVV
jgi:hypothetical protein